MDLARAVQMTKVADALHAAACDVFVVAGGNTLKTVAADKPYPVMSVTINRTCDMWTASGFRRISGRIENIASRYSWVRKAAAACGRAVDDFRPDVIMSASEPYDSHCAVLRLKARKKMPWIAFFSDPSPLAAMPPPYNRHRNRLMNHVEISIVRRILGECDAIVMTNSYALRRMETAMGVAITNKSFEIAHIGTEPASQQPCTNPFLTHLGDLYNRLSIPLLNAVRKAAERIPDRFPGVLFVGDIPDELRVQVKRMDMEHLVHFRNRISHAAAQELASSSRALLLIEAPEKESPFLPGKFCDYAMTGRPILAITPPAGPVRDYLAKHGGGIAVEAREDMIAEAIAGIFSQSPPASGASPGRLADQFKASAISVKYLEVFGAVVTSAKGKALS